MSSTLSKLNLRPAEKRLVVVIGLVLFVVVNLLFVVPFFSEWEQVKQRKAKAERTLSVFNEQIAQMGKYQAQVRALESEGLDVAPEEQSVQFLRVIQQQQAQSGVNITGTSRPTSRTNEFFIEQSQSVSLQSGEKHLVDFLYNLGAGNSLVRVRDLSVGPDATRQNLLANVKLVASYQKKLPQRGSAPAGRAPAPAVKPPAQGPTNNVVSRTSSAPVRATAAPNRAPARTNALPVAPPATSTAKRP